jgi:endonuclease YncB( thermonuclease family)
MRGLGLLRDLGLALVGIALLLAPFVLTGSAHGAERLAGPVPATVTEVIDGDTVWAKAKIWVGQEITTKVRLAGINAPETGSTAGCASEKAKGQEAKVYLASLIEGRDVRLYDVQFDKYGGRVDARVVMEDDRDVSAELLAKGFAIPYRAAKPWCVN